MFRKQSAATARLIAAAGAALVFVVAVVVLTNGAKGIAGSTAASAFGWVVPLLAATLVGITAVALLHGGTTSRSKTVERRCEACGASVQPQWRLCPHCGALLTLTPNIEGATSND